MKSLFISYEFYICFEYFHNQSNSLYRQSSVERLSNCELDDFKYRVFAKFYLVNVVLLTFILSLLRQLSLSPNFFQPNGLTKVVIPSFDRYFKVYLPFSVCKGKRTAHRIVIKFGDGENLVNFIDSFRR